MKAQELCKKVSEFSMPIVEELNVSLWDVEFIKEGGEYVLTVYIDNEEGIAIETCEALSRKIDPYLDRPEFSSLPSYTLCVSSAGLSRKLTKDEHFEKFIGSEVELKFFKSTDGIKETDGTLLKYENGEVQVDIGNNILAFNMKDAAFVRLKPLF